MFLTSKYNKIILSGLMLVLSFLMLAQVGLAEYNPATPVVQSTGLLETAAEGYGGKAGIIPAGINDSIPAMIGKIVGAGLAFIGVVFFGLMIYAGIEWMFAMGKEDKINQAKEMIIAAVLGLIVVLAAYAITRLVASIFENTAT